MTAIQTLRVDIADRTCRNRSAKGSVYCNRHLKTAKDSQRQPMKPQPLGAG